MDDETDPVWMSLGVALLYGITIAFACFLAAFAAYWWVLK